MNSTIVIEVDWFKRNNWDEDKMLSVCITDMSIDMEEIVGVDKYNKNTLCEVL